MLLFDIGLFKSDAFLLVDNLQHKAEDEGCNTQTCQHEQWGGVVELRRIGNARVGGVEYLADEQGEQPETNVLNPEDDVGPTLN